MSEWIPVSERLPEVRVEVLVWKKYAALPFVGYYDGHGWHVDEEYYDIDRPEAHGDLAVKFSRDLITLWMPLPEPSKG